MEKITKENLIKSKNLVSFVLSNRKATSNINLRNTQVNFYNEVYTKATTFGLSALAFDDNTLMKSIAILSGILTYEELKYILENLRNILVTNYKLKLLKKEKFEKLYSKLTQNEIYDINYHMLEEEVKSSRK